MASDDLNRLWVVHLLDLFPPACVSGIIKAVNLYPALTAVQQAKISDLARSLRGRATSDRLADVLLELICLENCMRLERDGSEIVVFPSGPVDIAETLRVADLSVQSAIEILTTFEDLPPTEQQLIRAYHRTSQESTISTDQIAIFLALHEAYLQIGESNFRCPHVSEYQALSTEDGRELARYAVDLYKEGALATRGVAEDVLVHLAALVLDSLNSVHLDLARLQVYYPGFLYRGADAATRDVLIQAIEPGSELNDILLDIAWIGDDTVQRLFEEWHEAPPAWAKKLYCPPEDYAFEAGWHLTKSGERRDLVCLTSYRLVPRGDAIRLDSPADVIAPHHDHCGWCGRQLVTILDLDLRDPRLAFLGPRGERLRIAMCQRCTCYGTVYTAVDLKGGSRWSDLNVRPSYIGSESDYPSLPQHALMLGSQNPTPVVARLLDSSNVGGYPAWQQDAEYPRCPKCRLPMPFVGQVLMDDVDPPAEGTTYAFLCPDCLVAATMYQQT